MTDNPTPNSCPGYELILTVRELDGTMRARFVKHLTWDVDSSATRDDARWSQPEKATEMAKQALVLARDLEAWSRGQQL
jgi:hypothetical protein